MGGGGDDVGVRQRIGIDAARDQTGIVGHIDKQVGADRIGDLTEALEIDVTRIVGSTGDDQFRLVLLGQVIDLFHIDQVGIARHAVRHDVEPLARLVGRRTVRQVTAAGQVHAHIGVARLEQREEHRLVGLRTGMRLDVGEGAVEQLLGAFDGQPFDVIGVFAATVITTTGIALGILVGQDGALRFQNGLRDDVFRGDQFNLVLLAVQFAGDRRHDFGVLGRQIVVEIALRNEGAGVRGCVQGSVSCAGGMWREYGERLRFTRGRGKVFCPVRNCESPIAVSKAV